MTEEEPRTDQQNRALHLWLEWLANEYQEQGISWDMIMKETTMEFMPTKESIKEVMVKPLIKRMFGINSTTQLKKQEQIDKIVDVFTKFNAKIGVGYIPFPSEEDLENNEKK